MAGQKEAHFQHISKAMHRPMSHETNTRLHQLVYRQRQIEHALWESENRYRSVVETAGDVILCLDTEGRILEWNRAAERVYGWTRDEVLGMEYLALFLPGEEREVIAANIEKMLAGDVAEDFENPVWTRDGHPRSVRWNVTHLIDSSEELFGILAVGQDVTEHKRAEAALQFSEERAADLRDANTQLLEEIAERKRVEAMLREREAELEAVNTELDHFTRTVAHDLKSPLMTIKGFVGLLEQDVAQDDAPRIRHDIERLNAATQKMHRLLDELLELSRIGRIANPSDEIALSELVHEAVSLVAGRIAARGVKVEIDSVMPVILGDRIRLLQVFQNLIDNAVKFMGTQPDPHIKIGARYNNGALVIFIKDNGKGIAAKYHEKVFDLFERIADHEVEGTGLGLALVKRIVEVHGGRTWVESEGDGCGATFCFTLPRTHVLS